VLVSKRRPSRQQVSQPKSIPAPIGGLNARDAIAEMPATDALVMTNWFPTPTNIQLRGGCANYATGIVGWVETLMTYNAQGSTPKMFGAAGANIYDVTAPGAVGAVAVSGLTSARWQYTNFGTPGGQFLVAVNGADKMQVFNGTAWQTVGNGAGATISSGTAIGTLATITTATPHGLVTGNTVTITGATPAAYNIANASITVTGATTFTLVLGSAPGGAMTVIGTYTYAPSITGVDTALLIAVAPFKQRLIFIEKNSSRFWYLPVFQIGGSALSFDLANLFKLGGYLMAFADWNVDTVDGPQSYATFISSMGEVVVYQGYDPSIPGAWTLVGVFRIGRPIGRRCLQKFGSDVYVISADGLFPLSQAMLTDRTQDNKAVSNKIQNLINNDVQAYGANFGWQVILYPIGNKIIVNVPQVENSIQYQYVMNTITGAWCLFQGWGAACWELLNDGLFYGGNGIVVKADTGTSDNGSTIQTDLKPAFSDFGTPGQQKQWTMVRPVFTSDNDFVTVVALNVDFSDLPPTQPLTLPPLPADALWDVSPWDITSWNGGPRTRFTWTTIGGIGFYASLRMRTLSKGAQISLQSIDYVGQPGGIL
jgi:hypothetical protein